MVLQAELQTERQRVTLYDSTKAPMDFIRAGGRHDFIIEHDIKELGPHTYISLLSCLSYNAKELMPKPFSMPFFFVFAIASGPRVMLMLFREQHTVRFAENHV